MVVLFGTGCFNPSLDVTCDEFNFCPTGLACRADGRCVPTSQLGVDSAPPDAPIAPPDAAVDAVSMPACSSDSNYGAPFEGSVYRIDFGETEDWLTARASCQALGADLVVIESAEEDAHLRDQVSPVVQFWIGLAADGASWRWIDGTDTAGYENWRSGEPTPELGRCARWRLSQVVNGEWLFDMCTQTFGVGLICECPTGP